MFCKPAELVEAETVARTSPPGQDRRAARAREKKIRRRWKSSQTMLQGRRGNLSACPSRMTFKGVATPDWVEWSIGVTDHCSKKYYDPLQTVTQQRRLVEMLRICQDNVILDGWRAPVMTFDAVLRARSSQIRQSWRTQRLHCERNDSQLASVRSFFLLAAIRCPLSGRTLGRYGVLALDPSHLLAEGQKTMCSEGQPRHLSVVSDVQVVHVCSYTTCQGAASANIVDGFRRICLQGGSIMQGCVATIAFVT